MKYLPTLRLDMKYLPTFQTIGLKSPLLALPRDPFLYILTLEVSLHLL